MTAGMWKYSQVVWAYLILDAATLVTSKVVEIPKKNSTYPAPKTTTRPNVENVKNDTIQNTPPPLGLFVAQASNIQELIEKNTFDPAYLNLEPRYARNFGMVAIPSEQRYRGVDPPNLSLFAKFDKKKKRAGKLAKDSLPKPTGSDKFLTPEFYKFKSDIEKETHRTHVRGLKMSPDALSSPTMVYGKPEPFGSRFNFGRQINPIRQESFVNPYVYDEPYSYEETPSSSYAKPVSYSQYSSIPNEPYYQTSSTGSGYYDPPSDYSYPSFPTVEPEPYYYPKSEPEPRAKYFSDSTFNDYPPVPVHNEAPISPLSNLPDYHYPSTRNHEFEGEKEEPEDGSIANDEDDFRPSDYVPEIPKKAHRNPNYQTSEFRAHPIETDVKYSRKGGKKSRPRVKPDTDSFEIPASANQEDEDEDFETPEAFQDDKDENLEDDSLEDEPPKARLRSSSRKQVKRVQGRQTQPHKKRCVKKRKEMSVEAEMSAGGFDEEPSKKMTCLVCENLDTGGTYETCSYASDPKKNSYYAGNEASFRKGSAKNPYKYRMRRQTVTIINSTSHPSKHVVRRSYNLDSIGSFTSDVEDFGEDFTEDETEDQQEDDDDELEEYKPSPPAYANEKACTEVTKNGLTCMVCHNPETNGKYKQCSYASDPDKNNYEYAQSSSYGSNDVPYKDRYRRHQVTPKNQTAQQTTLKEHKVPADWKQLREIEQHKIAAINDNFKKLVRMKKHSPDSQALPSIDNPSYEEQFLTLFPELAGGSAGEPIAGEHSLLRELNEKPTFAESSNENIPGFTSTRKLGKYFTKLPKKSILDDDDEDTEMSKMMKEFKTKDRSACKKTTKDKMTCYLCNDKDGIKREECMYVVENEPTKVSYQQTKQTNNPDQHEAKTTYKREIYKKSPTIFKYKYLPSHQLRDQPAVGTVIRTVSDTSPRKPNTYSKVQIQTEQTYSLKGLPSRIVRRGLPAKRLPLIEQQAEFSNTKKIYRKGRSKPKPQEEESESEDPEETGEYSESQIVPEADPSTPYGAFSEETLPVYSPELKISLPRYMLEKNEHEQAIDDFMSKM